MTGPIRGRYMPVDRQEVEAEASRLWRAKFSDIPGSARFDGITLTADEALAAQRAAFESGARHYATGSIAAPMDKGWPDELVRSLADAMIRTNPTRVGDTLENVSQRTAERWTQRALSILDMMGNDR